MIVVSRYTVGFISHPRTVSGSPERFLLSSGGAAGALTLKKPTRLRRLLQRLVRRLEPLQTL
jgi:hypothetical protein